MIKSLFKSFNPQGKINSEDKRFNYIDILYLIGILLVVWGHSHPIDASWYGTWYSDLNAFIYTFHMPMFFFIGGYLMVYSKSVVKLGYKKWINGKLLKFLIPYLVLTLLAFYPKAMLGDTSDVVTLSIPYLLKTTFLIPRIGVWGHFWFIPTFLILDILWGAWRANAEKSDKIYRYGLIIGFLVSFALAVFPIRTDYFVLYDLSQVAIFYACGIITALIKPYLWDKTYKNLISVFLCAFVAFFLYPYGNYKNFSMPIFNFIVGLCLVWICWSIAKLISNCGKFSIAEKLAKYNFTIFVYSWPAQSLLDVILRRMGVNWLIIIAAMFVIGFIAPILIIFIYKKAKFLHCKFFDYLIGIHN